MKVKANYKGCQGNSLALVSSSSRRLKIFTVLPGAYQFAMTGPHQQMARLSRQVSAGDRLNHVTRLHLEHLLLFLVRNQVYFSFFCLFVSP